MKCKIKIIFTTLSIIFFYNISVNCALLIPSGEAVGVALETDGLLVTKISGVTDLSGKIINCAHEAGIKKGDRIISVDGNVIKNAETFSEYIKNRPTQVVLKIIRNSKKINLLITPVKTNSGYQLGIWVRDSTAGIGTITYYHPENGCFAGLGHGISDVDTNTILSVKKGTILKCMLLPPQKGAHGSPGALNGIFSNEKIGEITSNESSGIYGILNKDSVNSAIETLRNSEIKTGDAIILSDVDGCGVRNYTIRINKVFKNNENEKNMIIEVTDPELLKKTGGIVQGMSGAPIIQNNKIAGAVTHVFVNNPKCGYAIFIENMLK